MLTLITSCGREDLLEKTLESLPKLFPIFIHEDKKQEKAFCKPLYSIYQPYETPTWGIGQHKSIEKFLNEKTGKFYFHCEDDWIFENTYDWIQESVRIMEADPMIIKVLCRIDSPHTPKEYPYSVVSNDGFRGVSYGYINPWTSTDGILWHGFSWNPGVTRLDLLKQFVPFRKWEQEVAEDIYNVGYRVAMLEKGVCRHIGENRSTHL